MKGPLRWTTLGGARSGPGAGRRMRAHSPAAKIKRHEFLLLHSTFLPFPYAGFGFGGGRGLEGKWWVDAQAHLPTATKNYAVCWPPLGTSTTRPLREVQVAAAA